MDKSQQEWLQATLNNGAGELSDDDLMALLGDESLNDASLAESIRFVETWLSRNASAHLLRITSDARRSMEIRAQAAKALVQILDAESNALLQQALNFDSPPQAPRG
jgi:hypothetical protein